MAIQWPSCFIMRTSASGSFIRSGCAAVILPPNQARTVHQRAAPSVVTRLNTPNDMRVIPAGVENKVADHREQAREKDTADSVALHEMLGALESFGFDENVAAPAEDQGATDPARGPIADGGTYPRAESPGQDDAEERHLPLRGPEGGGRNHNLARHRDDGAFHGHQNDDAQIAAIAHPAEPYLQQVVEHPGSFW